jgi:hypothetical protein
MGGGASLAAAIYTQNCQDRLQRVAREATKRGQVYADFIMNASNLLLNAYVHDGIRLNGDEQHLTGLAKRMRLLNCWVTETKELGVCRRFAEALGA